MTAILKTGATAIDLAWAAGVFDGDGCIDLSDYRSPRCTLIMTDDDVVRRFHTIIGTGSVSFVPGRKGRKDAWRWTASGFRSGQYVIAVLWHQLGERRRTKALEVLFASAQAPARRKDFCKRGHDLSDPKTTAITPLPGGKVHRKCRLCMRINSAAHYHLRKEGARSAG